MNNNKVYSDKPVPVPGPGPIPEKVVKGVYSSDDIALHYKIKLPPPPCPPEKFRASFHGYPIPPPSRGFRSSLKSYSRRGFRKSDDPFLIAYKECQKSSKKEKLGLNFSRRSSDDHVGFGLKKPMSIFSCKQSCNVVDDSIIKESKLPSSRSSGDRENHDVQ